jgi:integrase
MTSRAKKIIRKTWPKVREVVIKGSIFFQVDPRRQNNGKAIGGKRETFASKKKALARAEALAAETFQDGLLAVQMDPELRLMAIKGKVALDSFGKTIEDAVEHYLEFLREEKAKEESQTISKMVDLWAEEKKSKKRRKLLRQATVDDIIETQKTLKRNFGHLKILEASKKHFEGYLNGLNVGEQRRYNLRSRFSQFFNWCIHEQDIPMKNPLEKIVIEVPEKEVSVFTPDEAEKLLRLCQNSFPQLLAYHAISLFGGLRPSEAEFLEWSDIHLEEKQVKVRKEISKVKRSRVFTMTDTLEAWLKSIPKRGSRILYTSNNRGNLEMLRAKLGFKIRKENPNGKKWPEDILRHSFGTYWHKIHHDMDRLAGIMGNSASIIEKHYKSPVKESDAKKYWAILP